MLARAHGLVVGEHERVLGERLSVRLARALELGFVIRGRRLELRARVAPYVSNVSALDELCEALLSLPWLHGAIATLGLPALLHDLWRAEATARARDDALAAESSPSSPPVTGGAPSRPARRCAGGRCARGRSPCSRT